jgi:hypothetical protein
MPILVAELAIGDRVILNCPRTKIPMRHAQFEGLYKSTFQMIEAAVRPDRLAIFDGKIPPDEGQQWAAFLFWSSENQEMRGAFAVGSDGRLRDEDGRKIYIVQRLGRANQG